MGKDMREVGGMGVDELLMQNGSAEVGGEMRAAATLTVMLVEVVDNVRSDRIRMWLVSICVRVVARFGWVWIGVVGTHMHRLHAYAWMGTGDVGGWERISAG
ncbi:hypothetical protein PIB30_055456 [Stylosanthes scabra]|uniref:Uncharacterized protein n=1 Tax=Stylosanthes scabra TaxID=79078 RepID=A0ABU6XJZ7_9FABA|nr:hypothetical protein [Stylosanthes scabra]